jgi:F420-non-reducing hydrogenase iron-sulfur subunit
MAVVEEMIDMLGLEQERFRIVWCSSAEADRFVGAVREMTETVKGLGPSPYAAEVGHEAGIAGATEAKAKAKAEAGSGSGSEPLYGEREVVACR